MEHVGSFKHVSAADEFQRVITVSATYGPMGEVLRLKYTYADDTFVTRHPEQCITSIAKAALQFARDHHTYSTMMTDCDVYESTETPVGQNTICTSFEYERKVFGVVCKDGEITIWDHDKLINGPFPTTGARTAMQIQAQAAIAGAYGDLLGPS